MKYEVKCIVSFRLSSDTGQKDKRRDYESRVDHYLGEAAQACNQRRALAVVPVPGTYLGTLSSTYRAEVLKRFSFTSLRSI